MVSLQVNHNKCVVSSITFSKTKFVLFLLNIGWLFIRGKDKRKTLTGTTKQKSLPLKRGGLFFTVIEQDLDNWLLKKQ